MALPLAMLVALATTAPSVSLRTNKGALNPQTEPTAELLIVAKDMPADATVEVTATSGTVSPLRPLGGGRYQATYTAPTGKPPTMAFLTARARFGDDMEVGHLAIALHGQVELDVAIEPKKKFTVEAGGRTFGPFTANGQGHGKATVVVAPRVQEATIHEGSSTKVVALQAPPVSLINVVAVPEASHGNGEDPLVLEVYFVDSTGYPGKMVVPKLAADKGMLMQMGPKTNGLFRWVYEAPEGQTTGTATLTTKLPNDPDSTHVLKIALRPSRGRAAPKPTANEPVAVEGLPAVLRLQASVSKVVAGQSGEVIIDVTRYGKPVLAAELKASNLEADLGTVVPVGETLRWLIPPTFGGRTTAVMRASVGGSNAELQVALEPGPPVRGTVTFEAAQVRAGRSVMGRVAMTDAHFNPVAGARIAASATAGQVTEVKEEGGGSYRFTYQAPDAPGTTELAFQVEGGPKIQAPQLSVAPALSGLGLAVGAVMQGHSNLTLALGGTPLLEFAVRLPSMPLEIVVRGGRSFYQEARLSLPGANATQVAAFGGLGAEGGLRWSMPLGSSLALHAAGAAVGRRTETAVSIVGGPADGATESSVAVSLGGSLGAGVSLRLGAARFLVEGTYVYLPASGALKGNLGGLSANAGVLVEIL